MLVSLDQKRFNELLAKLKSLVYEYNSEIGGKGVYLKPYHVVYKGGKKYVYVGRYWYRLERRNGRLKWIYLGKTKPYPDLPDPPAIPEITIVITESENLVDQKALDQLK